MNLTLFLFLGIVSFESISCPRFNCGLGSLATLYFYFSIGISIHGGIFAAGICDFVTFVESINASGKDFVNELSFGPLIQIALWGVKMRKG